MGSAARVQMLRPLLQVRSCLWALLWLRKTIKILGTCGPMSLGHWTSHSKRCRSRKESEHRRCMAWRQPGIQAPEAQGGGTIPCGDVAELRDIGVWHLGWLACLAEVIWRRDSRMTMGRTPQSCAEACQRTRERERDYKRLCRVQTCQHRRKPT